MKRNRHYQSPDGLDWRDPNMPVSMAVRQGDGSTRLELFTPEEVRLYMEYMHEMKEEFQDWRNDPTYNLNRKVKP